MTDGDGNEPVSLVDRVLKQTRERILAGEYPPGMSLKLQRLAEESGASLIPVREALRVLQAERLVIAVPNKGAHVAPLSLDDMRDLYATRILIEAEAVRTVRRLTKQEGAELKDLLKRLTESVSGGDHSETIRLHRQFHFAFYDKCESHWLNYLIDILWKHTERYQRLSIPFRHDAAHKEHRRILNALIAGDNDKAADAMTAHLSTTARLVEEGYESASSQEQASTA